MNVISLTLSVQDIVVVSFCAKKARILFYFVFYTSYSTRLLPVSSSFNVLFCSMSIVVLLVYKRRAYKHSAVVSLDLTCLVDSIVVFESPDATSS